MGTWEKDGPGALLELRERIAGLLEETGGEVVDRGYDLTRGLVGAAELVIRVPGGAEIEITCRIVRGSDGIGP